MIATIGQLRSDGGQHALRAGSATDPVNKGPNDSERHRSVECTDCETPSLDKGLIRVNSSKASFEFVLTAFDAPATDERNSLSLMILHAQTLKLER